MRRVLRFVGDLLADVLHARWVRVRRWARLHVAASRQRRRRRVEAAREVARLEARERAILDALAEELDAREVG